MTSVAGQASHVRVGVVLPPGVVADGNGAGPTSAAMASSDIGAWVPSATTAVQALAAPADAFLDGLEEERQRAVPGAVGDDHAQRASGQVERGDLGPHERRAPPRGRGPARVLRASTVTVPPPGATSPSVVRRSSMRRDLARRTRVGTERRPAESPAGRRGRLRRPGGRGAIGSSRRGSGTPGHVDAGGRRDPDGGHDGEPRRCRAIAPGGRRRRGAVAGAACSTRRPRPARTCGRAPGWQTAAAPRRRTPPARNAGGKLGHLERVVARCPARTGR